MKSVLDAETCLDVAESRQVVSWDGRLDSAQELQVRRRIWIHPLGHHAKIACSCAQPMHVFNKPIGHISDRLSVPDVDKDRSCVVTVVVLVPQPQFLAFTQEREPAVAALDMAHAGSKEATDDPPVVAAGEVVEHMKSVSGTGSS